MNSIIALEELIRENEKKVTFLQKQLTEHEAGYIKLTRLSLIATEMKLEEARELLTKYKNMLEEIVQQEDFNADEHEEEVRIKAAIERKKYFENQYLRIENDIVRSDDKKLEAMMIIDELPIEVKIEDDDLFEIANKSVELDLAIHKELNEKLELITTEFKRLTSKCKNEQLKEIELLNYRIPILVLHFSVLLENIKKNYEDKNEPNEEQRKPHKKSFNGFPKYEDWWIKELWTSHQAYFALFKWKQIISKFCKTGEQKRSWIRIFDNWIFVKKILNDKEELAFEYNFAVDSLLKKYANLEEELDNDNLKSMDTIIQKITKKEDFSKIIKEHNINTNYLEFKRNKLKSIETISNKYL